MRRVEHIIALKPEICSLDLNTMWSGSSAVINPPANITIMAKAMKEAGAKPELEVFDSGDIAVAKDLIKKGVLDSPALFQIVTGISYGFECTPQTMMYAKSLLPPGSHWAAFGVGRLAFPSLAQAFLLGGHVRIGLEDAVYFSKSVLAPTNASMAEKAKRIINELGGELATAKEARQILGLAQLTARKNLRGVSYDAGELPAPRKAPSRLAYCGAGIPEGAELCCVWALWTRYTAAPGELHLSLDGFSTVSIHSCSSRDAPRSEFACDHSARYVGRRGRWLLAKSSSDSFPPDSRIPTISRGNATTNGRLTKLGMRNSIAKNTGRC